MFFIYVFFSILYTWYIYIYIALHVTLPITPSTLISKDPSTFSKGCYVVGLAPAQGQAQTLSAWLMTPGDPAGECLGVFGHEG